MVAFTIHYHLPPWERQKYTLYTLYAMFQVFRRKLQKHTQSQGAHINSTEEGPRNQTWESKLALCLVLIFAVVLNISHLTSFEHKK